MSRKSKQLPGAKAARRPWAWVCPALLCVAFCLALWWFMSLLWVSVSVESALNAPRHGSQPQDLSQMRRSTPPVPYAADPVPPPAPAVKPDSIYQSITNRMPSILRSIAKQPQPARSPVVGPDLAATGQLLHVVIISISRPGGFDYLTNLLRLIQHQTKELPGKIKITVFDADARPDAELPKRPWLYNLSSIDIARAPFEERREFIATKVNLNSTTDAYKDNPAFILSRSKESLDYAYVLECVYQRREEFPYSIVLEDDSWLSDGFFERAFSLIDMARSYNRPWLAFNLFHDKCYDTQKSYRNGASFEFKACTQAMLWHASEVSPLVSFAKGNFMDVPADFNVRNYQYDQVRRGGGHTSAIYVAIPSMVQHIGLVRASATNITAIHVATSNFAAGQVSETDLAAFKASFAEPKEKCGRCHAYDYVPGTTSIETLGPLQFATGSPPAVWNVADHERVAVGGKRPK